MNLAPQLHFSRYHFSGWLAERFRRVLVGAHSSARRLLETMELPEQAIWALPRPQGARIECLSGVLWITHDWQCRDICLTPGQSYTVDDPHRMVVQALEAARLQVRLA